MKKVIIVPSNTDLNRGDQALVWESIRVIKDAIKEDVQLSLIGYGDTPEEWYLQNNQTEKLGYPILKPILKHPGRKTKKTEHDGVTYSVRTLLSWGFCAVVDFLRSVWLLSSLEGVRLIGKIFLGEGERKTYQRYEEADAIFVKGGGFIHSYGPLTDIYLVYFLLFHINLGLALRKPVIVFPNSFGPLKNRFAKMLVYHSLRKCRLVTSRESVSNDFLSSMDITSYLYPDLGLYLQPSDIDMSDYLRQKGVSLDMKNVLMTARPYRFGGSSNAEVLYGRYIDSFVQLTNYLFDKGWGITLFAHTLGPSTHEDDRLAIRDIMSRLTSDVKSKVVIIDDSSLNCREVEKLYSYYDYLVGTRFHSVIFGLNVGVPALAIAYGGNKGTGIMKEFDLSEYCLKIDEIEGDRMIQVFDNMIHNREEYVNKLHETRIIIDKSRVDLIDRIGRSLEY